ncbi:hypothetical protein E1A91_D12G262600v1 [Gossypium mustelinum]|uniref:Uncharacterized protein n=3 Tax=Gossypium TaxID=3633 RepID=A0A0D2U993_GOSRA|nr:hypothetical protein B456_008G249000 [Gossypium raimondii]TYH40819.1 hypothetical protein ES332_D12G273100v1 [Gossypium tomentosum]TYI52649.1 hypothetical protein E1A91_D12G262600v1 [Gossypium mustelinum]
MMHAEVIDARQCRFDSLLPIFLTGFIVSLRSLPHGSQAFEGSKRLFVVPHIVFNNIYHLLCCLLENLILFLDFI